MFKKKIKNRQNADVKGKSNVAGFFKSNSTQFIAGFIILIVALYTAVAVVSSLYSGGADQSKVDGLSLFDPGDIDGIKNCMGLRGAILSNILMTDTFGISSLFMLVFLMLVGLRLMKAVYMNLLKIFIICSSLTVWSSLALSYFIGDFFNDTAIYIGGKHGLALSGMLCGNFGSLGTFMLILLSFILIMAFISSQTIPFIQKLFRYKPKIRLPEKKPIKTRETMPNEDTIIYTPPATGKPESKKPAEIHNNDNTDDGEVIIADGDDEDITNTGRVAITPSTTVYEPKLPISPISDDNEKDAEKLLAEMGP
ncbi:MAG: DNA translocase FtsK 4TM domain-containing protein, partial [Dysgonamonadaceae bacterium]|nr:DNA translocase FtsK 4TM domain-containing protein [Dysgonamonadaceae bacterium]